MKKWGIPIGWRRWRCIREHESYITAVGFRPVIARFDRERGVFTVSVGGVFEFGGYAWASHESAFTGPKEFFTDDPETVYKVWPRFRLKKGLPPRFLARLDYLFASLHNHVYSGRAADPWGGNLKYDGPDPE